MSTFPFPQDTKKWAFIKEISKKKVATKISRKLFNILNLIPIPFIHNILLLWSNLDIVKLSPDVNFFFGCIMIILGHYLWYEGGEIISLLYPKPGVLSSAPLQWHYGP